MSETKYARSVVGVRLCTCGRTLPSRQSETCPTPPPAAPQCTARGGTPPASRARCPPPAAQPQPATHGPHTANLSAHSPPHHLEAHCVYLAACHRVCGGDGSGDKPAHTSTERSARRGGQATARPPPAAAHSDVQLNQHHGAADIMTAVATGWVGARMACLVRLRRKPVRQQPGGLAPLPRATCCRDLEALVRDESGRICAGLRGGGQRQTAGPAAAGCAV